MGVGGVGGVAYRQKSEPHCCILRSEEVRPSIPGERREGEITDRSHSHTATHYGVKRSAHPSPGAIQAEATSTLLHTTE